MKFQRFKRGSVVMVEFSPSMGSEIKGKHLAIVLTKNDSPNNGVLTVIPLKDLELLEALRLDDNPIQDTSVLESMEFYEKFTN